MGVRCDFAISLCITAAAVVQVKCDNGVRGEGGWEPKDVKTAVAALQQSASTISPSSSSSRSSSSGRHWGRESHDLKITGSFGDVHEGAVYDISGEWVKHPTHGWQIK
jgi:hypothetical protein